MSSDSDTTGGRLIRIGDDGSIEICESPPAGEFRPMRSDEFGQIVEQFLETLPEAERRAIETRLRSQSLI